MCHVYQSRLLFEGSVYFIQSFWLYGYYSRVATIQELCLFEVFCVFIFVVVGYQDLQDSKVIAEGSLIPRPLSDFI